MRKKNKNLIIIICAFIGFIIGYTIARMANWSEPRALLLGITGAFSGAIIGSI